MLLGSGLEEGSAHTCEDVNPGLRGLLASTPFHVQAPAALACPSGPEAARLCSQPTCPKLSSRESPSTSWGGRRGLQGQRPTADKEQGRLRPAAATAPHPLESRGLRYLMLVLCRHAVADS